MRIAAALLALCAACAPAVERVYVAPNDQTVTTGTEASLDGRGQHIWVHNQSTVEIVVTSLRLYDCENVRNRCEVQRLQRRVGPGQRTRLTTVLQDDPNARYNYRYSWSWRRFDAPETPEG